MKTKYSIFSLLTLFLAHSPLLEAATGKFGGCLDARKVSAQAGALPIYNSRPLTIECWANLHSNNTFNIIIANEYKSAPTHWELYSYSGSGVLSAYLPSATPSETKSTNSIADGKWHYLAMTLTDSRVRLYIDGQETAKQEIHYPRDLKSQTSNISFGALTEGGIGFDGLIDEVRISKTVRSIERIPGEPFKNDEHTIGLWRFDTLSNDNTFRDHSKVNNPARLGKSHKQAPPKSNVSSLVSKVEFNDPIYGPWRPATSELSHLDHSYSWLKISEIAIDISAVSLRSTLEKLPLKMQINIPRKSVRAEWGKQFTIIKRRIKGVQAIPFNPNKGQQYDNHALILANDRDPLDVVLRRTKALLNDLGSDNTKQIVRLNSAFLVMEKVANDTDVKNTHKRNTMYLAMCALRRQVAFANPLLDFNEILFAARGTYAGCRKTSRSNADSNGGHFATQYFAFNTIPGGGLYRVKNFKNDPEVVNILKDSVVENGRLKGKMLTEGAFLSPDLCFDGATIAFAHSGNSEHKHTWNKDVSWNIFKVRKDGSALDQLTDSAHNEFDPCWLPNGRIAFISEARGGYIRCFTKDAGNVVPSYVLHSMKPNGSDLYPLSFYETSEWQPSVDNNGMIVYTRWDYTDREDCLGSNFWICYPDGRDPRAPHGNYPHPWHTFKDNTYTDSRIGRPHTEMNFRAIPDSHLYIFTAAPHHGESFGSLCVLDLHQEDDGHMSQIKRITPYVLFPEMECSGRSHYQYGTAWALNENFFLCNYWESIFLLDRYGNRELICENELCPHEQNDRIRLVDPIPLKSRNMPPIIPTATYQGDREDSDNPPARISIMNVYDSDIPFPRGTKIKWLRVTQNILKSNPWMDLPRIGYAQENTPRIPLGIVPVEVDGSCHFEAPINRELIFQVLDENFMAVQSMRSVAYVHRGEHLSCVGCHENPRLVGKTNKMPLALKRPPSKLAPEIDPVEPITYYRLVKSIFEKTCLPCHAKEQKGPQDMSYDALNDYVFFFAGGFSFSTMKAKHGGSRTIPGRFGAMASRMGKALLNKTHQENVSPTDYRKVVLWLDSNSLRLGANYDEEKQIAGEVVWPKLDVDPQNPQGLQRNTKNQ